MSDWTQGEARVVYQQCDACTARWYFRRDFCPRCGGGAPRDREAVGAGSVYAVTLVARAPTEELRAFAPYCMVLVDTDDGFRMMGHGAHDLRIGARVRMRFVALTNRLVPYFEKVES